MISINLRDNADEFRVEIVGRFAGSVVDDVMYMWNSVLRESDSRRFTIVITQLTGYDEAGCSLLMDMHKYGAHISAGSPRSLVFLNEISQPAPSSAPKLVRKRPQPTTRLRSEEEPLGAFPLAQAVTGNG